MPGNGESEAGASGRISSTTIAGFYAIYFGAIGLFAPYFALYLKVVAAFAFAGALLLGAGVARRG